MKVLRLSVIFLLLSVVGVVVAEAQSVMEHTPTIIFITHDHSSAKHDINSVKADIHDDYKETTRRGFQQVHNPQVIFATHDNRFSLALGGYVNLRTSYDVKGTISGLDFVPYDIPMSRNYANKQRVMMDASTSRLFLKAIINSRALGQVVVYSDLDFRGGEVGSYLPRLRSAYMSLKGFTIGRDVTTFCDLNAAPTTIDFQGPNAYNFNFNEMIRYECNFMRNHFAFALAAESPIVNATYGEHLSQVYQRVPDIIGYLQYAWGENRGSHLRVSAVIRDMYLHNKVSGENTTQLGWGIQLSGHLSITRWVDIFMNGVYGKGITPYIQDLTGSPYDFAYNPENPQRAQTMPMWGWQAAAQINIIPTVLWLSAGYSEVGLEKENGYLSDNQYHRGQYIFGNVFFNATKNFTLAVEYLHGSRKDMNLEKNTANRLSIMAQYNF